MKEITDIIQEAVTACNLTLYGIERSHEGMVVYIEKTDDAVSIKDCEAVMKQINYTADTDHLHIEVSSKGVYPPLFTIQQYKEAIGQYVKVRTSDKSYKGEMTGLSENEMTLQKDEHTFTIALPSIKSARIIPMQTGE